MRIFLIILGALLSLGGFACGASGIAAYRSVGSDGYVNGGGKMTTATAALVTDTAEFESVSANDAGSSVGKVRIRISAERADGGPVLVAIGTNEVVEGLVAAASFDTVRDLSFGPFSYEHVAQGGSRPLPPPDSGLFSVSASGPGKQTVDWPIQAGAWRAIVMNADGSAGVDVRADFGVRFPYLRGFAIAGMVIGAVLLMLGILLLFFQLKPRKRPPSLAENVVPEP
ncbi:MAG: hypothetical protein ABI577_13330 [bacterium]